MNFDFMIISGHCGRPFAQTELVKRKSEKYIINMTPVSAAVIHLLSTLSLALLERRAASVA